MGNSTKRDGTIELLHPAIRDKVRAIRDALHKDKIPFEVFEAFRTPERQAQLYAKGRTKPGHKVTWVGPWRSIHQYGLAVDFVLKVDGKWSWDDQGAEAKWWDRMHELAHEHGMTPLYKNGRLIEKPHIQLEGITSSQLYRGEYPDGGDSIWAEHLSSLIDNWEGTFAVPVKPPAIPERPPIDADLLAELEDEEAPQERATLDPVLSTSGDARFGRLHAFVRKWEGGFVNHPRDDGGATNMGITQDTLAQWRGREVSVADVQELSRAEADAIFRAKYYTAVRCGEMPERMAAVVYNASVLMGPRRAITFVQRAFNQLGMTANGGPLEEDGILGPITMAAIRETDATALAEAFLDIQEGHHRAHDDFDVFGRGWLNRLAALREFVAALPRGAGKRPRKVVKVVERGIDLSRLDIDRDDLVRIAVAGATGGKSAVAKAALRRVLDRERELTPVNAALGQSVGRALDGKKSVTGIVGLILTAVLPELGILNEEALAVIREGDLQTIFFTLLSIFTGWGFLGKIDKAIREVKEVVRSDA